MTEIYVGRAEGSGRNAGQYETMAQILRSQAGARGQGMTSSFRKACGAPAKMCGVWVGRAG